MDGGTMDGGTVTAAIFVHRRSGLWVVPSRDLAVLTAHTHSSILKAVRKAEALDPGLARAIFWSRYEGTHRGRLWPCCYLARPALAATFRNLHNVPGCRDAKAVLAAYLELFDQYERGRHAAAVALDALVEEMAEAAPLLAEPAPDEAILPPDPEPADTLEPVPELRPSGAGSEAELGRLLASSWLINEAVERLASADMPHRLRDDLDRWNAERCRRLYEGLLLNGGSWAEANQIFATVPTGTLGRVECR